MLRYLVLNATSRIPLPTGTGLFLACVTLALVPGGANAGLENGSWYRYNSSNFEVYAKLRQKEVAERIRSLEAFRAVVHTVVALEDRGNFGHKTKILLLPSATSLRKAFKTRSDIIGFMRPGLRENLMVVSRPRSSSFHSENHVAFHEYVHYLVRNASSFRYPTWYDEGFAEMLATVAIEEDHAVVGRIPTSAAFTLLNLREMPLQRVVQLGSTYQLKARDSQKFYAKAWLLTHYLNLSGSAQTRQHLFDYLYRFNSGQTGASAFEDSFETSFEALESDLDVYSRSMPGYQIPLHKLDFSSDFTRVRMTPMEVAYELGYMTVPDNTSYARKLFTRILEAEPGNARALAGLGVSHQFEGDFSTAEELLRRALRLDAHDYLLSIELADLLAIACDTRTDSGNCAEPETLREIVGLYRRAYELEPDSLETIAHYGTAMIELGDAQEAVSQLQRASDLAPWSYLVVRNLAAAYAANRNWDKARKQFEKALGWAVDHPEEQERLRALLVQMEVAAQLQAKQAAGADPPERL